VAPQSVISSVDLGSLKDFINKSTTEKIFTSDDNGINVYFQSKKFHFRKEKKRRGTPFCESIICLVF
jgi:hypothetical protein